MVGCGRLYPRRPYIIRVNTFHVPSVESTLLHSLTSKGKNFVHTAPVVFQDSILGTRRYFELGAHFSQTTTVAAALAGLPYAGDWKLAPESIIWSPAHADAIGRRPACDYLLFISLYWRVNGANAIVNTYVDKDMVSRFDPTVSKVEEFINRHLPMSMYADAVENPVKDLCDASIMMSKKYMPLLVAISVASLTASANVPLFWDTSLSSVAAAVTRSPSASRIGKIMRNRAL